MVIFFMKKQKGHMDKTIDTYSMFGKEIKNTKQQWIARWQDCTVKSLMGLMPMEEYKKLEARIVELAGEDFERRYERENRS